MITLQIALTSLGLTLSTMTAPDAVSFVRVDASHDLKTWATSRQFFAKAQTTFAAPVEHGQFFRASIRQTFPGNPVMVQVGDSNTGAASIPWRTAFDAHLRNDAFALFDCDYMARNGEMLTTYWVAMTGSWATDATINPAVNTGQHIDFAPLTLDGTDYDPWRIHNGTADGRPVNVIVYSLLTNDFNHVTRREHGYWVWNGSDYDILPFADARPGETRVEIWNRKILRYLHDDLGCFIILRMPPPYTRYYTNGFDVGIPAGVQGDKECKLINDVLRRAYTNAAAELPNSMFFDTWEFVFGWPNGQRPADWDTTSDSANIPQLRDNLHYKEHIHALLAQELNRRLKP